MEDRKIKISIIVSLYKSQKYLEPFLINFLEIDNIDETELVIVHNEPTDEENAILNNFLSKIPNIIHVAVPLEPLYTSWNRAISLSKGEYLAMWSVDDRRTSHSLRLQADILDKNPDCMIVSGNYFKVFNYGDIVGFLKKDPVKKNIFNKMPKFNNGCFLMWRKIVHEKIGYFDEQFKVGGDWEFWSRVTYNYNALPCNTVLGYFLRINNEGLSKRKSKEKDVENQVVKLRFYNLFTTNIYTYLLNPNISLSKIKNFGELKPIKYNRYSCIFTSLPSFLIFWGNDFKRHLIRLRYQIKEKHIKGVLLFK